MQENEHEVLEQYDMEVFGTRKTRGAVLCDTDQGMFLLKEVKVSPERIAAVSELYGHLENQEWCAVDAIVKNQEEDYITTAENGNKYILKKWFVGQECDTRKPGEILEATGVLAKLHLLMRRKMSQHVPEADCIKEEYQKHNRELKKVRSFVRKYTPKNAFEIEFLKNYDEMFHWAQTAGEMFEESGYEQLYRESIETGCMVHGEYNHHNILMESSDTKSKLLAVTNFDKFKKDIQIEDFYYFLRKIMEKYGWKERLGDSMINAYAAVNPLSGREVEYLKIRLVYPEKFWKTANAYYYSNKAWIPAKNIEKLETVIRQTKEKERFLENVFSFTL